MHPTIRLEAFEWINYVSKWNRPVHYPIKSTKSHETKANNLLHCKQLCINVAPILLPTHSIISRKDVTFIGFALCDPTSRRFPCIVSSLTNPTFSLMSATPLLGLSTLFNADRAALSTDGIAVKDMWR